MMQTKLRQIILLAVPLTMVIITGCSPRLTSISSWQGTAVMVDRPAMWTAPEMLDERTGVRYAITNDSLNLYVFLQLDKPEAIMKMMRAGMELMVDTLGKNRGHCIIQFPEPEDRSIFSGPGMGRMGAPGAPPRTSGAGREEGAPDQAAMLDRMIAQKDRMRLSGFKNHPNGRLPVWNLDGITVHLDHDTTGVLNYRAAIPLRTFYKSLLTAADPQRNFTLIIKLNGIETPRGAPSGMSRGGSRPGGGYIPGRQPGGSMPGTMPTGGGEMQGRPGRGAMNNDFQSMTKTETLKIQFKLAIR